MKQRSLRSVRPLSGRLVAVGALISATALASACTPELEYGTWEADISGSAVDFTGAKTDWSAVVQIDVAYDKGSGTLDYEMIFCDGFVDYYSSTPCFNTVAVLDTTDGLVGSQEEGWQADLGDEELVICQGTESISLAGDPLNRNEAEVSISYHLNLSSSSSGACEEKLAGESSRIVASGTMVHVGP